MTFLDMLGAAERQNQSLLCVGLDPDPAKFPASMKGDASKIYDFCAAIVEATADTVIAFKPQIAYFAAHRAEDQLERLMEYMKRVAPQVPVILDAKRGDIGSTAEQYAIEAFEQGVVDYVLKPAERERLAITVERIRQRLALRRADAADGEGAAPPGLQQLLQKLAAQLNPAAAPQLR